MADRCPVRHDFFYRTVGCIIFIGICIFFPIRGGQCASGAVIFRGGHRAVRVCGFNVPSFAVILVNRDTAPFIRGFHQPVVRIVFKGCSTAVFIGDGSHISAAVIGITDASAGSVGNTGFSAQKVIGISGDASVCPGHLLHIAAGIIEHGCGIPVMVRNSGLQPVGIGISDHTKAPGGFRQHIAVFIIGIGFLNSGMFSGGLKPVVHIISIGIGFTVRTGKLQQISCFVIAHLCGISVAVPDFRYISLFIVKIQGGSAGSVSLGNPVALRIIGIGHRIAVLVGNL